MRLHLDHLDILLAVHSSSSSRIFLGQGECGHLPMVALLHMLASRCAELRQTSRSNKNTTADVRRSKPHRFILYLERLATLVKVRFRFACRTSEMSIARQDKDLSHPD